MPTIPGTSLLLFKQAVTQELRTVLPNVVYASPTDAETMLGEDGSGLAVWWGDDAQATIVPNVFVSGDERWLDEEVVCTLIVQRLGRTTDDTQETVDTELTNTLGKVIDTIALIDLADTSRVQTFDALPSGWTFPTGALNNQRAGRFELEITITARLKLS